MGRSDENLCPTGIMPSNVHGGARAAGSKLPVVGVAGQNRRALSTINKNIIGGPPYPFAVKRQVLAEKNGVAEKKPPVPVHRPVTRNFAAQMASKHQQPRVEETKPLPRQSVRRKWEAEDCIIIDDDPVPIFVQHTEAMLEEIDHRMDAEIEMEDVSDEPIMDIDSSEKNNPLEVTEYIDELYDYYRKEESSSCVSPDYMTQQFDINERMRAILIDWLIEVHYKFELMHETLYLAVNLIDRFLARHTVVRKKLQLVGVTAMLLACKYEEISVPVVDDFILISDKAYSRKEVLDMERLMMNALQFNLSVPTPYMFMRRFLKAAQSDKELELLSFFIIELCLVEYQMLRFPPSLLAASAVFTAQCTLTGTNHWSKTCEKYTGYSQDQLLECSKLMVSFHQKSGTGKLTGVYRKYSISKYGFASKTGPANFLLL